MSPYAEVTEEIIGSRRVGGLASPRLTGLWKMASTSFECTVRQQG